MNRPRWGASWLLLAGVVLALVAFPVAEIWLLIHLAGLVGWPVLGVALLLSAGIGVWALRREGGRAWRALNDALRDGRIPTGHVADAVLILVGGVLLILPGFLTDLVAVILLLPATRPAVRKLVGFVLAKRVEGGGLDLRLLRFGGPVTAQKMAHPTQQAASDVITGEIVDDLS